MDDALFNVRPDCRKGFRRDADSEAATEPVEAEPVEAEA